MKKPKVSPVEQQKNKEFLDNFFSMKQNKFMNMAVKSLQKKRKATCCKVGNKNYYEANNNLELFDEMIKIFRAYNYMKKEK